MALPFRQRILLALVLVGVIPTSIALVGWVLAVRANNPATATRAAVEQLSVTGRDLAQTVDSTRLSPVERKALSSHLRELNRTLSRVQRAEAYARYYYAGLTAAVLALGVLVLYLSVRVGGYLSRQLSRPIDELVGWTGHILREERLPPDEPQRGAPEFAALRRALREMAAGLAQARVRQVEAARLRTFREIARQVAHEMKNPLTPIRFAVAQLSRSATAGQKESIEVLTAEAGRLEALAREVYRNLGRLGAQPPAKWTWESCLAELGHTSLPPGMESKLSVHLSTPRIVGHYEPLRRAFSNLLRNAAEACGGSGTVELEVGPLNASGARVIMRDHGPGVPAEIRDRLFEPYVTAKAGGTGLGLALVRQTIEDHGGSIRLEDTPGGGATFVVELVGGKTGEGRRETG
jgi:signal transduction histidine kinase